MPSNGLQDFGHKKTKPPLPHATESGFEDWIWVHGLLHGRQKKWFGANVWSQPCVLGLWDYEANAIKSRRGYKCKYCVQHWYGFNNVGNLKYIHAWMKIFDGFIFMLQICSRSYIVCAVHCQCFKYSQPVDKLLLSLENDDKMWVNQTTLLP